MENKVSYASGILLYNIYRLRQQERRSEAVRALIYPPVVLETHISHREFPWYLAFRANHRPRKFHFPVRLFLLPALHVH